ncbi:MAG: flagellar hook capping FlgD N-terminal domain-containing protein [Phycisphaerae bacterium]
MNIAAANSNATSGATGQPRTLPNNFDLTTSDFIKMMITQLTNQDPMEPAKNEQLLAQMSQIGQLESSTKLQASLESMVLQNNVSQAGGMIGKLVAGTDDYGQDVAGLVTSVRVQEGKVYLELDSGQTMQMGRVRQIAPMPAHAGAAPELQ